MTTIGTGTFDRATTVTRLDDHRWSGAIEPGWDIGGNANGGYLLALAVNALRELAGRPDPISVTAHYLAPGAPGPVEVTGEVVKAGKRFVTVSGSLRSGDRVLLQVLAIFGDLSSRPADGFQAVTGAPPELPPLAECSKRTSRDETNVPLMEQVDVRLHPRDAGFRLGERTGIAEMAGWFQFADGRPIDTLALLLAADVLPPAVFQLPLEAGWVPTVELTVHVRARPAPGPLRAAFRSRFVHSGMLEEDGELWDSEGTLVALSRQLALLPR